MATVLSKRKTNTKAPVKAAPAKKEAPAAPKPSTPSVGLKLRKLDPAKIREQFAANAPKQGGAKTPYLKMQVGKNKFRIVLLEEGGFVKLKQHDVFIGGKGQRFLDFDALFYAEGEAQRQRLRDAGKLTEKDEQLYRAHGDPFNVFGRAHKDAGLPQLRRSPWPSTKYLFHVVSRADDGVYVYEAGVKFYEFIMAQIQGDAENEPEYPTLFDPKEGYDIVANATGEKLQRRYAFAIAKSASEVELPEGLEDVPDLTRIADSRYGSYEAKVRALFGAFPREAQLLGFTPASFGLGHIVVNSPAVEGADEDTDSDDD